MKKLNGAVIGLVAILGISPLMAAETAGKNDQATLQKEAKITMDAAKATALKRAPGKIESSELEREYGKLVYSFDIRNSKGTITEVLVNAISGKIVKVSEETKAQEAAEKKKEAQEKTNVKH